jgi:hypothetical protein
LDNVVTAGPDGPMIARGSSSFPVSAEAWCKAELQSSRRGAETQRKRGTAEKTIPRRSSFAVLSASPRLCVRPAFTASENAPEFRGTGISPRVFEPKPLGSHPSHDYRAPRAERAESESPGSVVIPDPELEALRHAGWLVRRWRVRAVMAVVAGRSHGTQPVCPQAPTTGGALGAPLCASA